MFRWCGYGSSQDNREFNVVIYENDYKELCAWVLRKPHIETGGDLFGLWANKYTAVIQLVLGPGKGCRRTSTSFYQDVNYLEKVGMHLTQKEGICYIGEWHSHHQLGLARPSGGDENTVWNNMPTYNLTRFVIFIANIDHSHHPYGQSYSVNVGCFLFEIDSNGKQLPVLRGKFKILNQESPFFGKSEVIKFKQKGEESTKEGEFNVGITDLTPTDGKFSIYIKQKKRVGQGNEHAQSSQPQKKKNRTDPPTTQPTTAQNQAGKQKDSEASSVPGKNNLGDPKTNEKEVENQKQQEERNEPPEQGNLETSNKEDRNNQNGANKTDENGEALSENKENSDMQGGNMKGQENFQAPRIELKENQEQQSLINQGNSIGIKAVDQGSNKAQNQCEQDSKNQEQEQEGGGRKIEETTSGTSVDHDRAKNLASNTEPANNSPAMPQHNPGENEGSKTSGYADMESKQEDTKANENEGKVQKEEDEEMKEHKKIQALNIQDHVNQSHECQQNQRKNLGTKEDPKKLKSPAMKGKNAPTTSQGQLDEKGVSRPDIEEEKETHRETNGKEVAAKNSGIEEEEGEGVQKKDNSAAHSKELQGNLGIKTKDHDNGETQSSERAKQENKTEVKNSSNYGGKQSSESLDNKGKQTLENTKESTEQEKSLDTRKGPTSGQVKKEEKKKNQTDLNPNKSPGTKGKPIQGAAPAPAASSGKSKPPKQTAKTNPKKPGVARKAK